MLNLGNLCIPTPAVMGILNVTPDSFSDGGRFDNPHIALRQAATMAEGGAAIIDIGGESTRPGAGSVGDQEELDRVIPIIEAVRSVTALPVSIDTSKAEALPGVMAIATAAKQVITDGMDVVVGGGVESISMVQTPEMRVGPDPWLLQNKPDIYMSMLETAETVAERYGISREEQDELTLIRSGQYQDALADDAAFHKRYMIQIGRAHV